MIDIFILVLVFSDGFHGGHESAAWFYKKTKCEKMGAQLANQYNREGHPTSFYCSPDKARKEDAKFIR